MNTVKLIMEVPKGMYNDVLRGTYYGTLYKELMNGIPLDDVKAEINKAYEEVTMYNCDEQVSCYASKVHNILDNIGKEESEDKE